MKVLQEYAVVRLKRAVPGVSVPVGTTGTVLIVYQKAPSGYEVEFMSGEDSLGHFTLDGHDVEEGRNSIDDTLKS